MKVTDDEILRAVWRGMVKATARGAVCKYVGSRYGLNSDDFRYHWQDIHILGRDRLGVNLGSGQLRRRIVRLIDAGQMRWTIRDCAFWIDCPRAAEVWNRATAWWSAAGIPRGYEKGSGMRCVEVADFDRRVGELEQILLGEFGDFQHPTTEGSGDE